MSTGDRIWMSGTIAGWCIFALFTLTEGWPPVMQWGIGATHLLAAFIIICALWKREAA